MSHSHHSHCLLLAALAFVASGSAAASGAYSYQTLDYPGAAGTIFWGIDDFGDLAGQYNMSGKPGHAMVYRHGQFQSLDPNGLFDAGFSAAGGPNDLGETFGGYNDAAGAAHGFLLRHNRVQTLDFAGHANSNVDGVNAFGAIAGVYWDADGIYHGIARRDGHDTPFDVPGARDTYPLGIAADGSIVGYWDAAAGGQTHGFYRTADGLIFSLDVPNAGAGGTAAFALNDVGQVAGYFVDAAGSIHGFVQTRGAYQTLDVPGAVATIATAMNNYGVVAGEYFDAAGKRHGFVATP